MRLKRIHEYLGEIFFVNSNGKVLAEGIGYLNEKINKISFNNVKINQIGKNETNFRMIIRESPKDKGLTYFSQKQYIFAENKINIIPTTQLESFLFHNKSSAIGDIIVWRSENKNDFKKETVSYIEIDIPICSIMQPDNTYLNDEEIVYNSRNPTITHKPAKIDFANNIYYHKIKIKSSRLLNIHTPHVIIAAVDLLTVVCGLYVNIESINLDEGRIFYIINKDNTNSLPDRISSKNITNVINKLSSIISKLLDPDLEIIKKFAIEFNYIQKQKESTIDYIIKKQANRNI